MNNLWNGLILIVAIGTVIGFYFLWTQTQTLQSEEELDYKKAEQILASPQPLAAMQIINNYQPTEIPNPNNQKNWLDLKIKALTMIPKQGPVLAKLYQNNPKAFDNHETASQMVAGMFLAEKNRQGYLQLKKKWATNTKHPQAWFVLDGYELLQNGKPQKAITFLHSGSFSGPADPEAEKLIDSLLDNLSDNTQSKENLIEIRKEIGSQKPEIRSQKN